MNGGLLTDASHACACVNRGFVVTLGSFGGLYSGGAYGNGVSGAEISHGARAGVNWYTAAEGGFQSNCNGFYGLAAQSGFILVVNCSIISNGYIDLYAFNMGLVSSLYSQIGGVSPDWGSVGNYNSVAIFYG